MNFSKTQTTNYVAIAMFLIQIFKVNISQTEVEGIVTAVLGLGAIGYNFWLRYSTGDLKLSGKRVK
jgi:hypothetical protein